MKFSKKVFSILCIIILLVSSLCAYVYAIDNASTTTNENQEVQASTENWAAAWATPTVDLSYHLKNTILTIPAPNGITLRTKFFPSLSGNKGRIKIANTFGETDLHLDNITIAAAADEKDHTAITSTPIQITFHNETKLVLSPGQSIYSDEFSMDIKSGQAVSVSMCLSENAKLRTVGLTGGAAFAAFGDQTTAESFSIKSSLVAANAPIIPFLSCLDVYGENLETIAIIGDSSITNDIPAMLQSRISAHGIENKGVVGVGIVGNRVLTQHETVPFTQLFGEPLVDRIERDALGLSGLKYLIVKCGVNDIQQAIEYDLPLPTAKDIADGLNDIAVRANKQGVKTIFLPITSWKNFKKTDGKPYGNWNEEGQTIADELNIWMQSHNAKEGVAINLDALNNLIDPKELAEEFTVDNIHYNENGQKLVANSIPLSFFDITNTVENDDATTQFVIPLKGSITSPFIIFAIVVLLLFIFIVAVILWIIVHIKRERRRRRNA